MHVQKIKEEKLTCETNLELVDGLKMMKDATFLSK